MNRRLVVKPLSIEMEHFNTLTKSEKIKLIGKRKRVLKVRLRRIRNMGLNKFVNDPRIDENLSYSGLDLRRLKMLQYDVNFILNDEFKLIVMTSNNKTTFIEEIKIIIARQVGKSFLNKE